MATNRTQRRVGEAAKTVTQIVAGDAAQAVTQRLAKTVTKRRYKARARLCGCGCGQRFTPTPQQPRQRYFSDACRQRARRAKMAKQPRCPNKVDWYTCENCAERYIGVVGKGRKYCTTRCKRAAAQARRDEAAAALANALGIPLEAARDTVDVHGMTAARRAVQVLAS